MEYTDLDKKQIDKFNDGHKKLIFAVENVIDLIKNDLIKNANVSKKDCLELADLIFQDLKLNKFENASTWVFPFVIENSDFVGNISFINKNDFPVTFITHNLKLITLKFKDYIRGVMMIRHNNDALDVVIKAIQNEIQLVDIPTQEKTENKIENAITRLEKTLQDLLQNEIQLVDVPTQEEKGIKMEKRYFIDIEVARTRLEKTLREALLANGKPNVIIATIVNSIIKDLKQHYVTLSQEDPGKISYAKKPEFKTNRDKRTKTTLSKYIKKYYKMLSSNNSHIIDNFEEDFMKIYNKNYSNNIEKISLDDNICDDRETLIEAMDNVLSEKSEEFSDEENELLSDVVGFIEMDKNNHFLSLSKDVVGMVSYAKDKSTKFDNSKRIRINLNYYINKYVLPNIVINYDFSKDHLKSLLKKFSYFVMLDTPELEGRKEVKKDLIKKIQEKMQIFEDTSENLINKIESITQKGKEEAKDDKYSEIIVGESLVKEIDNIAQDTKEKENSKSVNEIMKDKENIQNDREKLIDAIKRINKKSILINMISNYIINDNNNDYLSLSQDDKNRVSYSKYLMDINKFNSNLRTKIDLSRYIEKYVYPHLNYSNRPASYFNHAIKEFEKNVFYNINEDSDSFDSVVEQKKPESSENKIKFDDLDEIAISKLNDIYDKIEDEYNLAIDRDLLICSLKQTLDKFELNKYINPINNYNKYLICDSVYKFITHDKNRHYLSLSQEDEGRVSYSKTEINRYNNDKRTKNNFYKYLKMYVKPNINIVSDANEYLKEIADVTMDFVGEKNPTTFIEENLKENTTKKENIQNTSVGLDKPASKLADHSFQIDDKNITITTKLPDKTIISNYKISGSQKKITRKTVYGKDNICTVIHYYDNENTKNECTYLNKKLYRKVEYFNNNKIDTNIIKSIVYYKNGFYNNPMEGVPAIEYFDENGKLVEDVNYKKGVLISKNIYWKNGKIKKTTNYNMGSDGKYFIHKSTHFDVNGDVFNFYNTNNTQKLANPNNPCNEISMDINTAAAIGATTTATVIGDNKTGSSKIKKEASSAGYRIAANQISKGVRRAIIMLMKETGMSDTKLKHVEDVLDSEVGLAIISAMMGYSLTYSKYQDERIKNIAKEFRTEGIATAGNVVIDEAVKYIIPAIKESMEEAPDGKFRIKETKEIKKQEEVHNMDETNKQQEVA